MYTRGHCNKLSYLVGLKNNFESLWNKQCKTELLHSLPWNSCTVKGLLETILGNPMPMNFEPNHS